MIAKSCIKRNVPKTIKIRRIYSSSRYICKLLLAGMSFNQFDADFNRPFNKSEFHFAYGAVGIGESTPLLKSRSALGIYIPISRLLHGEIERCRLTPYS